jgi:hypothetical protein
MPPARAGVASAVISVTRQVGSLIGVAVMGDMVTTGVRDGMASGQTHAVALTAATDAPWALSVACGVVVAVAGYLSTTARAQATAAAVAATAPADQATPEPVTDRDNSKKRLPPVRAPGF